jgi:RimJ/RimL family protein N-acetyltransferase
LQNIEDLSMHYVIGGVHAIEHLQRASSEPHQIIAMNKWEPYFLVTSRLGFRKWHEDDLSIAIELWGDYEVTKFFDVRGKLSRKEVEERLAKEIMCQKEHGVQYWPIFLLETNIHVGCCGLRPYDLSQQIYEIGFHIRSNQWRRGYAREAADAVIDYAFNTLKAKSLFAGHNPKNDTSRHILKLLGFRYTHDEYYPPTGVNHPSYSLNANDYSGNRFG